MLDKIFFIFDIPLSIILSILVFCSIFFIKNIYNLFLSLLISIFILIFISSTILTQQIFLGEFLIISSFFLLTVIFFIFNLNDKFDDSKIIQEKISKKKIFLISLFFLFIFLIIGFNFDYINNSNNQNIFKNNLLTEDHTLIGDDKLEETKQNIDYDVYLENISLLNQNKIFQKLTHILMFYVCLVVVLYFFNRGEQDEG